MMSDGKHLKNGSPKPELPDDGMHRLYSMRFCPHAHRVHLVLNAKKIPYHSIFINLTEKPEWLTEVSILGVVPALVLPTEDGQPTLIKSYIVSEYLDEKYPEISLMPKDPFQKALDKILIGRFNAVVSAMYNISFHGITAEPRAITDLLAGLNMYEQELGKRGSTYFGGDKPGMLDYMIWPWGERLAMLKYLTRAKFELEERDFKYLVKWRDTMIKDPAVKCFYLDGETHAKFVKSRKTGNPDYNMLL